MKAVRLVPLESVVAIKGGGTPSTEKPEYWNGDIPWVSPKDMKSDDIGNSIDAISTIALENSAASLLPANAVLVVTRSGILARTVPIALTTRELTVNQDIKALCANDNIEPRFLFYFMRSAEPTLLGLVTRGATVHRLSTDDIRSLQFPLLPMQEQKRIVGVLDEAFGSIATARANTEKNLQNARAVFESHLQSELTQSGDGWLEKPFSELCDIKHGYAFDGEFFTNSGEYVLLTPGNFYERGGYRDRGEKQKYYVIIEGGRDLSHLERRQEAVIDAVL